MSYLFSLAFLVSLPLQFALPLPGGFDLPLARGLALCIITLFLIEQLAQRQWPLPSPVSTALLLSFLLWVLASLLWVERLDYAFPKIAFLFNVFPLFFVWEYQFRQKNQGKRALQALLFGAGVSAALSLAIFLSQFLFGVSETFHFLLENVLPFFLGRELAAMVAAYPSLLVNIGGETWLRATAVFPDPHVAAFFFGISGFLALGMARLDPDARHLILLAGALFLADILTFSRGGYLGLLLGAAVYALSMRKQALPTLEKRLPMAIAALIILLVFGQPVASRFLTSFTIEDASSMERLALWQEAARTIVENHLLGTGIGNYLSFAHPLASAATPFYAHNLFFDVAIELGLVGFVLFFSWIAWGLVRAYIGRRSYPFAPAALAALSLYLGHSIFETALFSLHVSALLVFVLALIPSFKSQELVQ